MIAVALASIHRDADDRNRVSGLNKAGKVATDEDALAAGFIVECVASGPLDIPHARDAVATPYGVPKLDAEFDQPALHARHVASAVRHVEACRLPLLD